MPNDMGRCPFSQSLGDQHADTPAQLDDFRNLFGPAAKEDQYQGARTGRDCDTIELMLDLEACMVGPDPGNRDSDSGIPAGYTYLAQLAAHDLMQNETPLPRHRSRGRSRTDLRHRKLLLETIYGGGPGALPLAYENEDKFRGGNRTRLRLHRTEDTDCCSSMGAFRDLPRASISGLSGPRPDVDRYHDVLIADPRNDDHLIINQLTVFFHLLHNWIEGELAARPVEGGSDEEIAERRFLIAKGLTTYLYRRVIFNDLLEQILHPAVYKFYSKTGQCLGKTNDWRMPVEFSHGALRAGHAMVKGSYDINKDPNVGHASLTQLMDRAFEQSTDLLPHASDWWLQWSAFFPIQSPEFRRNVRSRFDRPQESNPVSPLVSLNLFIEEAFQLGRQGQGGLIAHDLLRGAFSRLRSVDSLCEIVRRSLPGEVSSAGSLLEKSPRSDALKHWLRTNRQGRGSRGLDDNQISILADDPPLLFFVLVEAESDCKAEDRKGFGVLGSVLLAEVFYGYRKISWSLIEGHPEIPDLATELFQGTVPDKMPRLIEVLANETGLAEPGCRFL